MLSRFGTDNDSEEKSCAGYFNDSKTSFIDLYFVRWRGSKVHRFFAVHLFFNILHSRDIGLEASYYSTAEKSHVAVFHLLRIDILLHHTTRSSLICKPKFWRSFHDGSQYDFLHKTHSIYDDI